MHSLIPIFVALVLSLTFLPGATSCGNGNGSGTDSARLHQLPDTLKVATLYGPLSFFFFREDTMGYDYALIKKFAETKNLQLDITVASNLESAVALLDSGDVDLVAYGVPVTAEYLKTVSPCGPEIHTSQVLVQPIIKGQPVLTDVTELVGREVWVEPNSKYQFRLENLNEELGGGIDIHYIANDSLSAEDIIEMVSRNEIPLSIVDNDIARLNRTYYRNIDVSLPVSFAQRSAWAVRPDNAWLGDTITEWFDSEGTRRENEALLKRYFELSKNGPEYDIFNSLNRGQISQYDNIFKKYAQKIGWDWRLLATIGYIESQFNNHLVSWAGAKGIMQVMPSSARAYGVNPDELVDPETCIALAADILKSSEAIMARYIDDPEERQKFVVAAYNSGAAHIIDAIALAKKYGKDASKWDMNVEVALLMKSDERYYNDPVVKFGYFRGRQTTQYIDHVYDFYERVKKRVKE